MKNRSFRFLIKIIIILYIPARGLAFPNPQILAKSIGPLKSQRIWALSKQNFSDVRYDVNGDGEIDEWLLIKNDVTIQLFFKINKVSKILFQLKKLNTYTKVVYIYEGEKFNLQEATALEKPMAFMARGFGKENNSCDNSNLNEPIKKYDLINITNNLQNKQTIDAWSKAIATSCENLKEPINKAVREVFLVNNISENRFITCLAAKVETQDMVTSFVSLANTGPTQNFIDQISCQPNHDGTCGKATFTTSTATIKLPITSPPCNKDMASIYRKQIFHETLHSLNYNLPEEQIISIVDQCENPKSKPLNDVHQQLLAEQKGKASSEKYNAYLPGSVKENAIAETARSKVTNIPKSLAEGSLAIPAPEPQTPGMVALNNSFQESRAPASASVTIPLQQSLAMSAPFFKAAAKVFSNYKLEPMQGQAPITTQLASQKNLRAPAARVNAETSQATKIPSAEPASFAKSDNSKPTAPASTEPIAAQATPAAQASTGARSPEVGSGGARGIASAPSTNSSTSVAVKPRVSDDASIDQERAKVAQNLVKMSIPQAREYIKSNEGNLERLKILILSQKNQRWGYKDPSRAAVLIQEVNGQLRIESQ